MFAGFPGLLELSESKGMPLFQQNLSHKDCQEFEGEISDVLNSALKGHRLLLARAWIPCFLNHKCLALFGVHPNYFSVLDVKWRKSKNILSHKDKDRACTSFCIEKGKGIVGKAFMTRRAFLAPKAALSSNPSDPLCHIAQSYGLDIAAIAILLQSSIHKTECVLECFFLFNSAHKGKKKRISTALISTLKGCCKTLRVVADEVLEEPSDSTFQASPSLQPFDTVEQSVAKDSLILKENPRKADPKCVMRLLAESSDQNERFSDPTPRIEPAKTCDAIGQGFPGLLERSESNGMPPFQQSLSNKAHYQEFESEISDVLNSALIENGLPLARAWVPCVQNRKCWEGRLGPHPNSVSVLDVKCGNSGYILAHKDLACTFFHMEKGERIVGKAFMTNQAFLSPEAALSYNPRDPLCHIAQRYEFMNAAIALPLQSIIDNSEYKVLDEPSNSTFLAFPSRQPFGAVEHSVAKDSLIPKENPREANPKRVKHLLPKSSDQNERCPYLTPRIEPAKVCDAVGLGSLVASETSEERHATGEKTVNVPDISLNDSAKCTGDYILKMKKSRVGKHLTRLCF
ncbi:hypothetical protein TIFTF001_027106 [Ficus carica]|uniref:NLP1-9 GAF domain-containing protein n=1 Tax=Ficus carica TaxID=3494 RepID=A0AA88IZQ1_FICCA|nr:hypothetical protein TIFTF001_027106 [Ficus carica]